MTDRPKLRESLRLFIAQTVSWLDLVQEQKAEISFEARLVVLEVQMSLVELRRAAKEERWADALSAKRRIERLVLELLELLN
jgi:hypothetical protein